jgi:hypothetical protein
MAAVTAKYTTAGWNCIAAPAGGACWHFIAQSPDRKKLHFVYVVSDSAAADAAKNDFVQNALSNAGVPVFAYPDKKTIRLVDVNTTRRIVIAKAKEPSVASASS